MRGAEVAETRREAQRAEGSAGKRRAQQTTRSRVRSFGSRDERPTTLGGVLDPAPMPASGQPGQRPSPSRGQPDQIWTHPAVHREH